MPSELQFEKLPLHSGLDYQPLFGKGACTSLLNMAEHMAEHMDMALLILTNKKSACLNQAGCINCLLCSSNIV